MMIKKRDSGDDDKETKKRRTGKDTESSKKSSNPNESSKVFEMGLDDVDQTFDKKADDFEQPSPDANTEQPYPAIAANPKRQKNDWYKKSPNLEPQDPYWNTVKTINDAQEQPWFKEKVNVAVPLLMFDELISTPIDFLAFAMNCLGLTTLTREVLVCYVFNLLKCTCKSYGYDRLDIDKPLPLIKKKGRLTIPVEVFFNNDLEYLKGDKSERTYCSSITKCPAARCTTWNKTLEITKTTGYGYLKEIIIKRADQKHYTFKEGNFPDLNLRYIEDMLLLIAQQKINNLDGDVIVDFVTALKMFTRSIVVQNRVEDVHDGILHYVHKTLHTRLQNLNLGFNPKSDMPNRAWSTKDQERTSTILKKIDDVLLKRRIIRSLEVLVGGRKTEMDKRLLQRT
ncbi:hypothetical protein Tco_1218236, partial [Tanacetum coccineum]